jgi:hypothetical protein
VSTDHGGVLILSGIPLDEFTRETEEYLEPCLTFEIGHLGKGSSLSFYFFISLGSHYHLHRQLLLKLTIRNPAEGL